MLITVSPNTQGALCCFHLEDPSLAVPQIPQSHTGVLLVCQVSKFVFIIAQWEEISASTHVKKYLNGPQKECVLGPK